MRRLNWDGIVVAAALAIVGWFGVVVLAKLVGWLVGWL